jgi:site-specific DNA-methyltransferase (adenine-specific)
MIEITNECNMELMARYPDNHFELAIVDPPYGIGADKEKHSGKTDTWKGKIKKGYVSKNWDSETPKPDYFKELKRVSKNQIIWGGNYFGLIGGYIFWNKKETMPTYSKGELAWTSLFLRCDLVELLWAGYKKCEITNRIHPTQKPVKLYEWLLMNYAKEGDKILDTHLGSGSIALACHNLSYNLTACELDKEYYDAAMLRLKQHQAQLTMF